MRRKASRPPRGQHFLHDKGFLDRIASALPVRRGCLVIEIGAGEGALTERLLKAGARVTALEIDPKLVGTLSDRFAGAAELEVVEADVLDIDLRQLIGQRSNTPVLVAGNLPYYITSPILRRILEAGALVSEAVLLMQREVAQRVVATKGSRSYGYLSVLCQLYSEPEYLFSVPPGAFRPPPKVTSAAVRLTMRRPLPNDRGFEEFLKRSFRHPRKTLLNNLVGAYDRAALASLPECGRRAQQLSLEELRSLWKGLGAVEPLNR